MAYNTLKTKEAQYRFSVFSATGCYACLVADDAGIVEFFLPEDRQDMLVNSVRKKYHNIPREENSLIVSAKQKIIEYFQGIKTDLSEIPVSLNALSEFTRKVLEKCRLIPFGKTETYKWLAEQVDDAKKARAAGNALNRNPVPIIIPCHRIIKSDSELGGFASGIDWKIKLLKIEGIIK